MSEKLGGQYVELSDYPDRPLEVRWKGVSLPYRVFEKVRRVSHAAVVENKRLGHTRTRSRKAAAGTPARDEDQDQQRKG